jgi:large subunit ribosomal protein L21
MYAVLETGSKQYRVIAGDTLEIERLEVEAGQPVTFDRVLLVNNDGKLSVGAPTVASASILADVVEHIRGEKKLTFKMKRRKGYHKSIGHRQELTVVKIKEIRGEGGAVLSTAPEAKPKAEQPAPEAASTPEPSPATAANTPEQAPATT